MVTTSIFQTGRVYCFPYHGVNRVALVMEIEEYNKKELIKCYDFTVEDYRNFYVDNIQRVPQDVTCQIYVGPYDGAKHDKYVDRGMITFDFDGKLYAVNLGQ